MSRYFVYVAALITYTNILWPLKSNLTHHQRPLGKATKGEEYPV